MRPSKSQESSHRGIPRRSARTVGSNGRLRGQTETMHVIYYTASSLDGYLADPQ